MEKMKINLAQIKVSVNFVLYNLGWVAAVIGASKGSAFTGPCFAVFSLAIHLLIMQKTWIKELKFVFVAVFIGSLFDSILAQLGYVTFAANEYALFGVYPIWMSSLWAGFATTLSLSLRWIKGRFILGAMFGALGGPASLYAGSRLGAAVLNGDQTQILLMSGVEWAALIPLIMYCHKKLIP